MNLASRAVAAIVVSLLMVGCSSNLAPPVATTEPSGAALNPAATVYLVTDYGAVGDSSTDNQAAFQKAIDAAGAAGGGRVEIPPGTYLTGPIKLRSGVDLHADAASVIKFSRNFADYPLVYTDAVGYQTLRHQSPITAESLHDFAITGPGTFDGSGDAWRPVKKSKLTQEQWNTLVKSGGVVDEDTQTWWPTAEAMEGQKALGNLHEQAPPSEDQIRQYSDLMRPHFLLISNCQNVLLDGPTFQNSPDWTVALVLSQNIVVRNVTVFNQLYAQNGDGIDLDSSKDVLMENDTVYAGDDNICLKSGRDEAGRKRHRATENVIIRNCVTGWGHGGIVIGSEMSGGVHNIHVSNITCRGTDIGLRFKSVRGRGGVVEDIHVDHVTMTNIRTSAILFDLYYEQKNPHPEPVTERTPCFRNFQISNITCEGAGTAITVRGLPELPLSDVSISDTKITSDAGAFLSAANNFTLDDVQIQCKKGPALSADNVTGLNLKNVDAVSGTPAPAPPTAMSSAPMISPASAAPALPATAPAAPESSTEPTTSF
jgi:polygalacturonase